MGYISPRPWAGCHVRMTDWVADCLAAHNRLRAEHGAARLQWSEECRELAQRAADHCTAAGGLQHTHMQASSQNIAKATAKLQECRDPRVDTVRMVSGAGAGSGGQSKQCRLGMMR